MIELNFQSLHTLPITKTGILGTAPILKLSKDPPWITSPAEQRQPYYWGNSKGLKLYARTWEQISGIFIVPHRVSPCTWQQPSLYPVIGRYRGWDFSIKAGLFFFKTGQLWRTILAPELPWISCNSVMVYILPSIPHKGCSIEALPSEPLHCMFPVYSTSWAI